MKLTKKQSQRRERIIKAAEEYVYANGFYKMSLDELVKQLRISKSTIYDYFGSKEGLVDVIVDRLREKLESQLEAVVYNEQLPVNERIIEVARIQAANLNQPMSRFYEDLRLHSPELWEKHLKGRKYRKDRYYRKLIEDGFNEGLFNPALDKEFVQRLYMEICNSVCTSDMLDHVPMTKEEAYLAAVKVFIKGVSK